MTIRIVIADDHTVVRQGLHMMLGLDPELEIVGEASDGAEALRLTRELRPDVVVLDLIMPRMDGIEATAAIRREMPETEVLALTSALDDDSVVGAIRAGAIGYVLKDTLGENLCHAVHAAAAGQVQLSPAAAARLVREFTAPEKPQVLSEREMEVLRLLGQGYANKEIAGSLGIGIKTVRAHVSSILTKLGLQSRTQAALYAVQTGMVPTPESRE
jgi:DNA-binding NarL/FixJ family response regulator